MIDIPALNRHDIFCHPCEGKFLVYAPLAGAAVLCEDTEVAALEQMAESGEWDEDVAGLLERSECVADIMQPDKIDELTVLLNQVCNFSCSYCYSANGRDKTVLGREQMFKTLDFFIDPQRGKELSITFSGGGDPMLSFPLLAEAVTYARQRARRLDITLHIGVVTNGSTLNDSQISLIKEERIGLVISCDILRDVHNAQRSHYDLVAATIDRVCREGISVGLRSTITPLNVERMNEMVEMLHSRFPDVNGAAFEAVLNPSLFSSADNLGRFYYLFVSNIFPAIEQGLRLGITIGNTIINNVDSCKTRSCLGKLVLTPRGTLTACSRIASPTDSHYSDFVYGNVSATGIAIDRNRYAEIMSKANADLPLCASCIAKYHCSGGCLLAHKSLPNDYFRQYCRFQKKMVTHYLFNQLTMNTV